mgnify:CR=1 FL=1
MRKGGVPRSNQRSDAYAENIAVRAQDEERRTIVANFPPKGLASVSELASVLRAYTATNPVSAGRGSWAARACVVRLNDAPA